MSELIISKLDENELDLFCKSMSSLPWYRDLTIYKRYLHEESKGLRQFIVAKQNNTFVGHVSILWKSSYQYFKKLDIPEISDLLVLQTFQRRGIATRLLEECERFAMKAQKKQIGLGVGLYHDYAPAMALYSKRGFQLDCQGATSHYQPIGPGTKVTVDDDLLIWLVKDLPE